MQTFFTENNTINKEGDIVKFSGVGLESEVLLGWIVVSEMQAKEETQE